MSYMYMRTSGAAAEFTLFQCLAIALQCGCLPWYTTGELDAIYLYQMFFFLSGHFYWKPRDYNLPKVEERTILIYVYVPIDVQLHTHTYTHTPTHTSTHTRAHTYCIRLPPHTSVSDQLDRIIWWTAFQSLGSCMAPLGFNSSPYTYI